MNIEKTQLTTLGISTRLALAVLVGGGGGADATYVSRDPETASPADGPADPDGALHAGLTFTGTPGGVVKVR